MNQVLTGRFIAEERKEDKKKTAEIKGQILPNSILNREIRKPINKISLPILYYVIILILNILTKIFIIH